MVLPSDTFFIHSSISTASVCTFFYLFLIWYRGFKKLILKDETNPKKCAWILSLFVSIVSTAFCPFYLYHRYVWKGWTPEAILESDGLSAAMCLFFSTFLVVDTVIGMYEYRSQFGLLSGWIHHAFYFYWIVDCYCRGYTRLFGYALCMESSSIFLSGEGLHRAGVLPFRWIHNDMIFGILFFTFRIVYHFQLLWDVFWIPNPRVIVYHWLFATFCLHGYWGYKWIRRYRYRQLHPCRTR